MQLMISLATPGPSPWNAVTITTAVIAALGFLLSLGSLSIAWGTYRRNKPRRAKFEIHTTIRTHTGPPRIECTAVNVGSGTARRVQFGFSTGVYALFSGEEAEKLNYGEHVTFESHISPTEEPDQTLEVRWSEAPDLKRRRSHRKTVHIQV